MRGWRDRLSFSASKRQTTTPITTDPSADPVFEAQQRSFDNVCVNLTMFTTALGDYLGGVQYWATKLNETSQRALELSGGNSEAIQKVVGVASLLRDCVVSSVEEVLDKHALQPLRALKRHEKKLHRLLRKRKQFLKEFVSIKSKVDALRQKDTPTQHDLLSLQEKEKLMAMTAAAMCRLTIELGQEFDRMGKARELLANEQMAVILASEIHLHQHCADLLSSLLPFFPGASCSRAMLAQGTAERIDGLMYGDTALQESWFACRDSVTAKGLAPPSEPVKRLASSIRPKSVVDVLLSSDAILAEQVGIDDGILELIGSHDADAGPPKVPSRMSRQVPGVLQLTSEGIKAETDPVSRQERSVEGLNDETFQELHRRAMALPTDGVFV